jgi:hypothetical protein
MDFTGAFSLFLRPRKRIRETGLFLLEKVEAIQDVEHEQNDRQNDDYFRHVNT